MQPPFISRILCPVDFSELSAAALQYSVSLSAACRAEVTALHAYWIDPPPYFTPAHADELKKQYQDAAGEMRRTLERMVQEAGAESAQTMVVEGDPAGSVLRAAQKLGADLIVMGTHGRRGIERFMLGSVAERVLRMSNVPVLTVRGKAAPIKRILCPVNNSTASRAAFQKAAQLALCLNAQLVAVHIEEDDPNTRIDDLCGWIAGQDRPACTVEHLSGRGNAAEEILKMAAESKIDLLVIGAAHKTFFDSTVLGSTTVRVVRHASCPVLTVTEGAAKAEPRGVAA